MVTLWFARPYFEAIDTNKHQLFGRRYGGSSQSLGHLLLARKCQWIGRAGSSSRYKHAIRFF